MQAKNTELCWVIQAMYTEKYRDIQAKYTEKYRDIQAKYIEEYTVMLGYTSQPKYTDPCISRLSTYSQHL